MKDGLEMYLNKEVAEKFAELEQNEKNFRVADIMDKVIMNLISVLGNPSEFAELGGGAHPDRYQGFFEYLLSNNLKIDWIDVSPYMLELAKKYLESENYEERKEVIEFIEADIFDYLQGRENETLDMAIMKYTFEDIKDIENFFDLLSQKLVSGGYLVSTLGVVSPQLKSYSTNARFLYNGEEFPLDETRTLKDGDSYTIKFLEESGNPHGGYLEGTSTKKYYHSPEKIQELGGKYGFECFIGDWKDFLSIEQVGKEDMNQDILVLKKI